MVGVSVCPADLVRWKADRYDALFVILEDADAAGHGTVTLPACNHAVIAFGSGQEEAA